VTTDGFRDRDEAGERLGARLSELALSDPLVLAIPRGGVEVGAAIARALDAELDVVLSRKLRAPAQPELALGAVSEGGEVYLNREAVEMTGSSAAYIDEERRRQLGEIARRAQLYRTVKPAARIEGRSVIITDDGLATGSTMIAGLRTVREQRPRELICAVPVAPPERLEEVRRLCDTLLCLLAPARFWAVGQFYGDFVQVADDRVVALLAQFGRAGAAPESAGG